MPIKIASIHGAGVTNYIIKKVIVVNDKQVKVKYTIDNQNRVILYNLSHAKPRIIYGDGVPNGKVGIQWANEYQHTSDASIYHENILQLNLISSERFGTQSSVRRAYFTMTNAPFYHYVAADETETDETDIYATVHFPPEEGVWDWQDRVQPHLTACAKSLEQSNLEGIAHLQALSTDICRDIPLVNGETHPVVQRHANTANMAKLLIGLCQRELDKTILGGTGAWTRAEVEALINKVCGIVTDQKAIELHFNRHEVTRWKQAHANGQICLPGALNQPGEIIYNIHTQEHNMKDDPANPGEKILDETKADAEFHELSVTHYTTASRHHKTDPVTERTVNIDTRSDDTDLTVTATQVDETALTVTKDVTAGTIKVSVPTTVARIKVTLALHAAASLYVKISGTNILNKEEGRVFDVFTSNLPFSNELVVVAENESDSKEWTVTYENPPPPAENE